MFSECHNPAKNAMRISTTTYGDAKRHAEVWHDSVGNLLSRTDARTITTCFGSLAGSTYSGSPYDASNRPTSVSYSDGTPTVTYAYDGVPNGTGQLTSITNGKFDDELYKLRRAGAGDGEQSANWREDV